jgi:hypothetical protein
MKLSWLWVTATKISSDARFEHFFHMALVRNEQGMFHNQSAVVILLALIECLFKPRNCN